MTTDDTRRSSLEKASEWLDTDGFYDIATEIRNICEYGNNDDVRRLTEVLMSVGTHLNLTRIIQ